MANTRALLAKPSMQLYFEQALSLISEAVVLINNERRVLYMNLAAQQITGCAAHQSVGTLLEAVLSIVDVVRGGDFAQAIEEAHGESYVGGTYRRALLLGCEGPPKVIEYSVTLLQGSAEAQAGSLIVFRDLMSVRNSERALETSLATHLSDEAALHEERERARVTLNSIGDAVVSTDFRGRVTFLNAKAEVLTGWTVDRASGRPLDEILPLLDKNSGSQIPCPAIQAVIEDQTCRSGGTEILVRPDGSQIAVDHSASPIHDARGGVIGVVMVAHDVTGTRNQADTLARLALYDGLTDLPNRTLLSDRLEHALHGAKRSGRLVAILFVDLDGFKSVNDTEGHGVGDQLLRQVAQRLLRCVRSTDTVSRYGGDEFVILLPDVQSGQDAAVCGANVVGALNKPFEIDGRQCRIGASVGIASEPSSPGTMLLKHADVAMYHAKSAGRNRVINYAEDMIYDADHSVAANCSG